MNREHLTRKDILRMLEAKQISSEEGMSLLKQLIQSSRSVAATQSEDTLLRRYSVEWGLAKLPHDVDPAAYGTVWVFDREEAVFAALQERSARAVLVKPGKMFRQVGNGIYEIDPTEPNDYKRLVESLNAQELLPGAILHLWSQGRFTEEPEILQDQLARGVFSVLFLTQALMEHRVKRMALAYIYRTEAGEVQPQHEAFGGFAKSLLKENPNFRYKTVGVEAADGDAGASRILDVALRELQNISADEMEVRYTKESRFVKRLTEIATEEHASHALPLKRGGIYLITGGVGGLGLIFARYLAKKVQAKLVLTGRSELSTSNEEALRELERDGAQVLYVRADVSKSSDVERLLAQARTQFGELNGILHSAGTLKDSFVLKKTKQDMETVLAPKVFGTVNLARATAAQPLDFFVLFSSLAAVMGNVGQSDYAFANQFMDSYAALRSQLEPACKTLSINWPLWQEGGMKVDYEAIAMMKKANGVVPLSTENGLRGFEEGLLSSHSQWMVIEAVATPTKAIHDSNTETVQATVEKKETESVDVGEGTLRLKTERYLKEVLSKEIKLAASKIDSLEPLDNYGLDSVMVMALTKALEGQFGELSKTLFYEYQNIEELASFFMEQHQQKLLEQVVGLPVKQQPSHAAIPMQKPKQLTSDERIEREAVPAVVAAPELVELDESQLRFQTELFLKEVLSKETKLGTGRIDSQESLENYGLDSVMVMALTKSLEEQFGELSKTLFYEYQNLAELTDYLMEQHRGKLLSRFGTRAKPQQVPVVNVRPPAEPHTVASSRFFEPPTHQQKEPVKAAIQTMPESKDDIAIIGVSGRYPMAKNLEEFWRNLKSGRDCVTEIPQDRWNYQDFYDPEKGKRGKMYSKWGGFIDDVDKFDPLFFNIAPFEAQLIDPQERLFLETVWQAVEDAGYNRQALSKRDVGVFVGIMYGHYQFYGVEESLRGNVMASSSSYASVANRVSYFFNFHGPSIALDTMCSSSLTAIHLACDSLHKGESEIAIAGGVNVTIHPNKYILLSQSKFLSSDGRCHTFGVDGDGYVPGEGVGAVILKPLQKAVADGDQIYAVIKSTSLNHGGKANGYFVPNPNAQASLISDAIKKAGVNPRTISYIEAHGTGTSLGDPIEITGLSKSFQAYTQDKQFCAIGSAKSNLGHLESAAGIAGITKLLLQFKHKQLVPSIHSQEINPNINFAASPFYVQRELTDWQPPVVIENGVPKTYPRRAGISAFGAGGANCHIILEEYNSEVKETVVPSDDPQVVVLSAKGGDRLHDHAKNMLAFLQDETRKQFPAQQAVSVLQMSDVQRDVLEIVANVLNTATSQIDPTGDLTEYGIDPIGFTKLTDRINELYNLQVTPVEVSNHASLASLATYIAELGKKRMANEEEDARNTSVQSSAASRIHLVDLAYTLQTGREAMEERLAFIVTNIEELQVALSRYCAGERDLENVYQGNVKAGKGQAGLFVGGKAGEEFLKIVMRDRELEKIAKLWITGVEIEWQALHSEYKPNRISLPSYPFARERHWLPISNDTVVPVSKSASSLRKTKLHPLVDCNISDLRGQKYQTQPEFESFYATDLTVCGQQVFPSTAVVEMMRAVGELATGSKVCKIKNLLFAAPLSLTEEVLELQVSLYPVDEEVDVELSVSRAGGTTTVYAQGRIVLEPQANMRQGEILDLVSIRSVCAANQSGLQGYETLRSRGVNYISGFEVISEWFHTKTEVLAKLVLPSSLRDTAHEYGLHPALLEGALQTMLLLSDIQGTDAGSPCQFAEVEELEITGQPAEICYAYAVQVNAERYNVYLTDENGRVLVTFNQARLAPVERVKQDIAPRTNVVDRTRVFLEKAWRESEGAEADDRSISGRVVVLANEETLFAATALFEKNRNTEAIIVLDGACSRQLPAAHYALDFDQGDQGSRVAKAILTAGAEITGFIDLSDLHTGPIETSSNSMGKMTLLQGLIKNVQTELTVLHFTSGLQALDGVRPTLAGAEMAGLVKLLGAEYRKVRAKTIDVDVAAGDVQELCAIVHLERNATGTENECCYRNGRKYLPILREVNAPTDASFLLPHPERVIVITGGTRGIGAEVAKHMVAQGAHKLVLMGMQAFPPREQWERVLQDSSASKSAVERIKLVQVLEQQGALVDFYTGSLTEKDALEAYFAGIRQKWGRIGGVFHCAGLASGENPAFVNKRPQDMEKVFEPKIRGLETLHELFANDGLDFFVLFSSISALVPPLSVGVSDYATANSFMDSFASFRYRLGDTHYKSINWTNWSDVGMGEVASMTYAQLGLTSHTAVEGLALLDSIMTLRTPVVAPCVGRIDRFDTKTLLSTRLAQPSSKRDVVPRVKTVERAASGTMEKLKDLFSTELGIPKERLDEETSFGDFGVDSIMLAELIKKMEVMIGKSLDPSIMLEYPTLQQLDKHLHEEYLVEATAETAATVEEVLPETRATDVSRQHLAFVGVQQDLVPYQNRIARVQYVSMSQSQQVPKKIAVIGMACHFPGAKDTESFWNNLAAGVSSVIEVPKSRWDIDRYYSPVYEKGKSISKWGGFIDGLEEFDPAYFQISEEDASQFDPLIRQFMEVSVETVRDAGYENKELWGKRVGVFVGSRTGNFASRITEAGKNTIVGVGQNFIAAHTSHFLNLKGPSIVVDTACSSSLVSIHLACQSLFTGESEMALAGGVDILMDVNPYIVLSEGRALSPDGKCHTFDLKANGFVPGEGCGAVLLKLLDRAIEDGDQIYAVIDATAINNDGHTMGITTPNLEAQIEVIQETHRKAGISPDTISYIETHGTGTMIGDPIELKALTSVFRQTTNEVGYCGVGSVKSNFGHLLSAAGIASFIKVVLSLHHKQVPPTINCETPNTRFKFGTSPFYPNTSLREWEPRGGLRRAGISSFGFGGTNAHIIVNECDPKIISGYQPKRKALPRVVFNRKRYWFDHQHAVTETAPLPAKKEGRKPSMLSFVDETQ